MTIITLPPEIEPFIARQAEQQGTTSEMLAQDALRRMFAPASEEAEIPETLYDFMQGLIGTVDGSAEPYSENCGERFADSLVQKQREGRV